MDKQITVRVTTVVVVGLVLVASFIAGISLPMQTSPQVVLGSQSLTNQFRAVEIKPSDDSVPLSVTLYTTPTKDALRLYSAAGLPLFQVSNSGAVVISNGLSVTGTATATGFSAQYLTGTLNAISLTGSLADARLSSNVPLLNASNTFTATMTNTAGYVGTLLTPAQTAITSVGTLSSLMVSNSLTVSGTLGIGGVSFSGVKHWGSLAVYTSGESISHGFSVTPTVCFLLPSRDVTSTITITTTGFSSNRATASEAVYWECGQ